MRYLIEHETVLDYPGAIREHHVELRLVPRSDEYQKVLSCVIETEPAGELATYDDYFLNRVDYFCVIPTHTRLLTRMRAEVETSRENPLDFIPVAAGEQQQWLQDALRRQPRMNDFVLHRSALTPHALKLADALPGVHVDGLVVRVSSEAEFTPRNVQTRTDRDRLVFAVDVRVTAPNTRLRPGMPVQVTLPGTARRAR